MSEKYRRDDQLDEVFDEEYVMHVESRKKRAQIRRAQQEKNNIKIMLVGGAIILLLVIILIASASCSSDTEENTPKSEPSVQTTTETTTPEETTLITMYTTDVLNLRAEPNTNSEVIIQIGAGKRVDIISEEGKWCKVKRGIDEGYVMKKYLSYMNTFN